MLVLSSYTEGLPNVVLEAFAYGRPVVATRVGGVLEVMDSGVNGLSVETGDVAGLTEGALRLLRDPGEAARMGRQGRLTVEQRFDFRARTASLEQLYDWLAGSGRRPRVAVETRA